jgi:hypothetical protein
MVDYNDKKEYLKFLEIETNDGYIAAIEYLKEKEIEIKDNCIVFIEPDICKEWDFDKYDNTFIA